MILHEKLIRSLTIGLFSGLMLTLATISYITLIFPGELTVYLPKAIGLGLLGQVIICWMMAWRTREPALVCETQDTIAVFLSIMVTGVAFELSDQHQERLLPTIFVLMAIAMAVEGAFFLLLGIFKQGSLVRFVPFPVMGGFLAGVGSFLLIKGIQGAATGSLSQEQAIIQTGMAISFAILIFTAVRYFQHYTVRLVVFVAAYALFHFIMWVLQIDREGWLIGPFGKVEGAVSLVIFNLENVDWPAILKQLPVMGPMVLTGTVELLLNLVGIEMAIKKDIQLDKELQAAGWADLAAAPFSALGGYHSYIMSRLGYLSDANNRIVGVMVGLLPALILLFGYGLLETIPRFLLSGYLVFFGLQLLEEWLWESWHRVSLSEYLLILLILFVIVGVGFLEGILFGILISALLFVVTYSKINAIKHVLTASNFRSNVDRSRREQNFLREKGVQIHIIQLHGFLFFGTVHTLINQIYQRALDRSSEPIRYLILDFRLVTGFDSSAVLGIKKLDNFAQDNHFIMIFTDLNSECEERLRESDLDIENAPAIKLFPSLDYGLEWCENQLIEEQACWLDAPTEAESALSTQKDILERYLKRQNFSEGDHLIRQGEAADSLFIIEKGSVTVILELPDGKGIRLRTMHPGTIVGDMGFFLDKPRTTSVIAEKETVALCLTKEAFEKLKQDEPKAAERLGNFVIKVLAERLTNSNNTIEALLR